MQPLIGVSCHRPYDEKRRSAVPRYVLNRAYVDAIRQTSGAPLLVPVCTDPDALRPAYGVLSGLLLAGGGDVEPRRFGQAPGPHLLSVDGERDEAELLLVRWAMEDDLPVLAICRGVQVLNVALGGTLIQDIPSQLPAALVHDPGRQAPRARPQHAVTLAAGSKLAAALAGGQPVLQLEVNSFHHQAVDQTAPSLRVVARAPDGVIEGLECPDRSFVIGVQWHPEEMAPAEPTQARLFAAFVAACAKRRG